MSDIIQVADLEKTKFHNTFHVEAVTGKVGGLAGGADIDFTTNAVTGQVQATLPKLLSQVGFAPVDFDFTTGGILTNRSQSIFYEADGNWYSWGGSLPKTILPTSSPASTGGISVNAWNISTSAFMYRDYRGVKDELYYQAGIIDDGTPNQIGDSQFVDAMHAVFDVFGTVAELATGKFQVGQYVKLTDRAMGVFLVKESGIANDIDILPSGSNVAEYIVTGDILAEHLGILYEEVNYYDNIVRLFELCVLHRKVGVISDWACTETGVYLPEWLTLRGTGKNTSGIKYIGEVGTNTFTAKNSKYEIGANPQVSTNVNKSVSLSNIGFDANDKADFGLYTVGAMFFDYRSVWCKKARRVSNFIAWTFTAYGSDITGTDSFDKGMTIGHDLFEWGGAQKAECNAVLLDKVFTYNNGRAGTYNATTGLKNGAGLIVGRSVGCSFNLSHCEGNGGVGLITEVECYSSFDTVYLEGNANDSSGTYYQVHNSAISAQFRSIIPQFNNQDVFYAAVDTEIDSYLGQRIIGPGYVSLKGRSRNATVQNLSKIDIKLSEQQNYDTATSPLVRANMMSMSPDAAKKFFRTQVYEVGVFIAFRSTVTINSGLVITLRNYDGTIVITNAAIPAGTYNNGGKIEVILDVDLNQYSILSWRTGGTNQNIGNQDIGIFARLII